MTYYTKQKKHKARIELFVSLIYMVGIGACYASYLHLYKGFSIWQAICQTITMFSSLFILMAIGVGLAFILIVIGKLLKKIWHKDKKPD